MAALLVARLPAAAEATGTQIESPAIGHFTGASSSDLSDQFVLRDNDLARLLIRSNIDRHLFRDYDQKSSGDLGVDDLGS